MGPAFSVLRRRWSIIFFTISLSKMLIFNRLKFDIFQNNSMFVGSTVPMVDSGLHILIE